MLNHAVSNGKFSAHYGLDPERMEKKKVKKTLLLAVIKFIARKCETQLLCPEWNDWVNDMLAGGPSCQGYFFEQAREACFKAKEKAYFNYTTRFGCIQSWQWDAENQRVARWKNRFSQLDRMSYIIQLVGEGKTSNTDGDFVFEVRQMIGREDFMAMSILRRREGAYLP